MPWPICCFIAIIAIMNAISCWACDWPCWPLSRLTSSLMRLMTSDMARMVPVCASVVTKSVCGLSSRLSVISIESNVSCNGSSIAGSTVSNCIRFSSSIESACICTTRSRPFA